jgi:hypothetical protein
MLGKVTHAGGTIRDLGVENREAESETKADRVCWGATTSDVASKDLLAVVSRSELSEVTVVITDPSRND